MTGRTDWISWVLQAVVGLFVGLFVGFMLLHRRYGGWLLDADCVKPFISGVALFTAGLASIYGDTMWMQLDYKISPPEGVKAGIVGRVASAALLTTGVMLVGLALVRHFQ